MASWYKVEIIKKAIYAIEIDDEKLNDKEKLDEAARLVADREDSFEQLICSPLDSDNVIQVLNEVDIVISC